ncbi:hypothetical protein AMECASPLE_030689, partial [Ameca splendens]
SVGKNGYRHACRVEHSSIDKIHNRCNDGRTEEWKNPRRGWSKGTRNKGKREDMRDERRKCKKEGGKNNRKENKVGKNKSGTGQRTRSSSLQNERLIHFKSAGAERGREPEHSSTSSLTEATACSSNG